ncbi:MAG: helix-turn-helix domain-containing protein [Nitrospira sp.]
MTEELFFDNKKYISAKDASQKTGYSKDYIGQLIRGNKLDSKRIGRLWYVTEQSILDHQKTSSEKDFLEKNEVLESIVELEEVSKEELILTISRLAEIDILPKNEEIDVKIVGENKPIFSKFFIFFDYVFSPIFFTHELLHALDIFPSKKATTFIVGLVLSVGAVSIYGGPVALYQKSYGSVDYKKLSANISQAPFSAYNSANEIVDFYSYKLQQTYLSFGGFILDTTPRVVGETKTVLKNPPYYLLNKVATLSHKEIVAVDAVKRGFKPFVHSKTEQLVSILDLPSYVDNAGIGVYSTASALTSIKITYTPRRSLNNRKSY